MATSLTRILYVEDDPDIRALAKIALEIIGGFNLRCCSSGKDALDLQSLYFAPELLLLDVMMPEMDGPTTLARLRELPEFKDTPVIFMTAKIQSSEILYYQSLGALGVIDKPFDPMLLPTQILNLWSTRS